MQMRDTDKTRKASHAMEIEKMKVALRGCF